MLLQGFVDQLLIIQLNSGCLYSPLTVMKCSMQTDMASVKTTTALHSSLDQQRLRLCCRSADYQSQVWFSSQPNAHSSPSERDAGLKMLSQAAGRERVETLTAKCVGPSSDR